MEKYEKHDFDYAAFEDAVRRDSVCLEINAALADGSLTHREHLAYRHALEARKRELADEISDFRGLQVLGVLATGSQIIDDLFSGKIPPIPSKSVESTFDLANDYTESQCSEVSAHSIGSSICEQVSPYSLASRSRLGGILDEARTVHKAGRSESSSATPAPTSE